MARQARGGLGVAIAIAIALVAAMAAVCVIPVIPVHAQWYPVASDLDAFIEQTGFAHSLAADSHSLNRLRNQLIIKIKAFATDHLAAHGLTAADNKEEYPYFRWIPPYMGSARPDGPAVSWEGVCFRNNSLRVKSNANGTYELIVTRADQKTLFCSDMYLFANVAGLDLQIFDKIGTTSLLWVPANDTTAGEVWDMKMKGIRVCMFLDSLTATIGNLLATVNLFISELTPSVPEEVAKANLDFLAKYTGRKMMPRNVQEVPVDASLISSGDFLGVVRLDGLDPMLAWAMGSSTGHTTVALWIDGQLYITESTTNGNYWPTNGIQKTPYAVWLEQAKRADYQVVWAPLSGAAKARFNSSAAVAKFKQLEGLDYGYHTMLWGWIDTIRDNYPCLPPDWQHCLQWEHIEMLFNWMDRFVPAVGQLLWDEAMNKRVGTTGKRIADVWMSAAAQGIPANTIPTIVEQDSWNYQTLRNGVPTVDKSMVCCVYVCSIWKAAGLFSNLGNDSAVNCAELTNWDDYALNILDTGARPSQCQAADPANPNCQLEGKYTLVLNDYATKTPYAHMAEKCPSLAPDYKKPADC